MVQLVVCNVCEVKSGCAHKGDNPSGTSTTRPLQHLWQSGISLTAADSFSHEEQHLHSRGAVACECRRWDVEVGSGFPSAVTINCHEQQLLWLDNLEQLVKVAKDFDNHFLLSQLGSRIVAMRAVVDDSIHVKVEVVYKRGLANIGWLVEQGISLTQPTVKLRDACIPCESQDRSAYRGLSYRDARLQSAPITAVQLDADNEQEPEDFLQGRIPPGKLDPDCALLADEYDAKLKRVM